ncbi:MAG: LPP20 family lipoprotein [Gammaproteobacteria bacterium]|nr:LPP20 family lipoprotein [Gammaproteobacteria bacterium]
MYRSLVLLFILIGLTACGGGRSAVVPEGPAWLDGTSAKYPNSQYIVGTGQSSSLDDAKNRARAEVAKVFEVAINEQSRDNLQYVAEGAASELTQKVERNTTSRTSKVLRGVEIADTWFDSKARQHYALAVLHRGRSARALRQQLEELDQATRIHIDKARKSNDKLTKVANAYAALTIQMERAGVQRSLQVVDNSGRGVPPEWNLAELNTDLRSQMERIRIVPRASGPEGFTEQVSGVLGASGFLVKEGETPDFTLSASLRLGEAEMRDNWYWVNGRMEILLSNAQGRIRGSQRWDIKTSATSRDVAYKRAMDKATNTLKGELRETLLGFAKE